MAGFLDEWRKPSRLLQDVKTKSIERTLLPLIKQVSEQLSFSLLEHQEKFSSCWFIHVCGRRKKNGKLDGKWKSRKKKNSLWMRCDDDEEGSSLVFVGCYFKMLVMCVNYTAWKGLSSLTQSRSTEPIHHIAISFLPPTIHIKAAKSEWRRTNVALNSAV